MFTGFSEKTGAFLWELAFHNERPWFQAHKQEFEDCVNTPFRALAKDCLALMDARFPDFEGRVHVSRIYRDARRLFGRGPYKDHLWFSLKAGQVTGEGPDFWFLLDKDRCSWGLGYFMPTPAQMDGFRRAVAANPARFRAIAESLRRRGWTLGGEAYKRPRLTLGDELLDDWVNRKWLEVEKRFDLGGDAYSDALPDRLCRGWGELMELYRFLLELG